MDELLKIDHTFNKGMFITKVNNIFIMLHSAIMMGDIDRVRHFLSDELEDYYQNKVDDLNRRNIRQMYDELNVKDTIIKDIQINDNNVIIKVDIISRYMDYVVDKKTLKFISGYNDHRIEKINHLVLEKKINVKNNTISTCHGCGASIDINNNGKCEYCGRIYDAEDYDWILTSLEVE